MIPLQLIFLAIFNFKNSDLKKKCKIGEIKNNLKLEKYTKIEQYCKNLVFQTGGNSLLLN